MIPGLMDVKELAQRLRVSERTLRNWAYQRKIPVVKVGDRVLFDPREIERWLKERSFPEGSRGKDGGEGRRGRG